MSERLPWSRILVEGVVIVASILLAFGIDASWETRGDAKREQRHLASLSAEFEQNDRLLRKAREYYEERYLDAAWILEALDGSVPDDAERRMAAFQGLMSNRTFHLESGAHDALLASGELDLIRDERLRNRLAAWASFVAEWSEEQEAVFAYVEEALAPALQERLRFRGLGRALPAFPDGQPPAPLPVLLSDPVTLSDFRGSEHFDNLVFRRAGGLWHAMRDGETLRVLPT